MSKIGLRPRSVQPPLMALIWQRKRETTGDTAEAPVVSSLAGLTAASAPVPRERWGKITKPQGGDGGKWAAEAWDYLDDVGELSFALLWKTALLSRFRLVASDLDPETGKPTGSTENQAAKDIVARIAGGATGQSQMLSRLAPLMMIPGEAWLAIIFPDGVEEWHILSADEVKARGQDVELTLPDGTKYKMDPETDTLSRIWRPDPRRSWLAWSAVKAARPILRQIVRTTQTIEAASKSRLMGNGVLILPSEVSMPTMPAPRGAPDPDAPNLPPPPAPTAKFVNANDIRRAIQEAMSRAIEDPSSAEAFVPIVLMIAGDYIKHVQHLRFDTEIGERALEALEKAVRRLAMTLDMPAEVLLGQADLNHWSLYGIEEQGVRWHAQPEMETICDALTRELMRPLMPPGSNTVIWYSTNDVDSQPDQIDHVQRGYTDGVVNADAYMRQLGLGEDDGYDLSTSEGWKLWATDQVRRDATLIPVLTPILRLLVPDLAGLTTPTEPQQVSQAPAQPAIEAPAGQAPPDTRDQLTASSAAAGVVRMCVNQALRLAGKRRHGRTDHARLRGVSAIDVHLPEHLGPCKASEVATLIEGWDDMVDAEVCANAGIGREQLRELVHATARTALTQGARPVLPWDRP